MHTCRVGTFCLHVAKIGLNALKSKKHATVCRADQSMAALYDRAMASPREAYHEAMRASQFVSITPFTTTIGALSASLFMKQQQQKQQGQLLTSAPISESVGLRVDTRGQGLALGLGNPTASHPQSRCPRPSNCQGLLSQQRKCLPCWCSQRNDRRRRSNRRQRACAESRGDDDCTRDGLVEPSPSITVPFGAETSFSASTRGSP